MKPALIALALSSLPAQAQVVQCWPTNYAQTVTAENNLGRLIPAWSAESQTSVVLANRTLTLTHTVFTPCLYYLGTKYGAPKQLEDVEVWSQVGGTTYRLRSASHIVYWASKGAGWVASTNYLPIAGTEILHWSPDHVGSITLGNSYWRTVDIASPLQCACKSLANSPYLVRFKCRSSTVGFDYPFRFEANEIKLINLAIGPANASLNGPLIGWFSFDMDEQDEQPLMW